MEQLWGRGVGGLGRAKGPGAQGGHATSALGESTARDTASSFFLILTYSSLFLLTLTYSYLFLLILTYSYLFLLILIYS